MKLRIQLKDQIAEQVLKMSSIQNVSPTQFIINLIKKEACHVERSLPGNTTE